jgi:hypothetical protein
MTWIRLFAPPQEWQLRVPVYFADVAEPLIGLELLEAYFRVRSGRGAWVLEPILGRRRRLLVRRTPH